MQQPAARKMYMSQSGGGVFGTLELCLRQRVHGDFLNAPRSKKNEESEGIMAVEVQSTEYFLIAGGMFEMLL